MATFTIKLIAILITILNVNVILAQQQEIEYNSDINNNGPHLLITESGDSGNQSGQDGWARIWLQNNSTLTDRWAILARPHSGAFDNVGKLIQPLIFAHNGEQKLGISSNGKVIINKQYALPKFKGTKGQVLTVQANGDSDWADLVSADVPSGSVSIFETKNDTSITNQGYSYLGPQRENFNHGFNPTNEDNVRMESAITDFIRFFPFVEYQGKAIIWGGSNPVNGEIVSGGAVYDTNTDTHYTMSTTDQPTSRSGHSAVLVNDNIFYWGGFSLNNGGIYNITNDSWSQISASNSPSPRSSPDVVAINNYVIVFGGKETTHPRDEIWDGKIYDFNADTWTAMDMNNAPLIREAYQIGVIDNKMIVYGGREINNFDNNYYDGALFDPASNSWTTLDMTNGPLDARTLNLGGSQALYNDNDDSYLYDAQTNSWSSMTSIFQTVIPEVHWTGSKFIAHQTIQGDPGDTTRISSLDVSTLSWERHDYIHSCEFNVDQRFLGPNIYYIRSRTIDFENPQALGGLRFNFSSNEYEPVAQGVLPSSSSSSAPTNLLVKDNEIYSFFAGFDQNRKYCYDCGSGNHGYTNCTNFYYYRKD